MREDARRPLNEEYHAHFLKAYDADFLSQLIFDKKNEYLRARGRQAN